jgi:tetratricopeptide (TPR) repeat protein/tRNA A-37 threonylcarbamoyl transferase component Bud32
MSFGHFRLLRLLGEGGMGSVWLADQLEPVKRQVAIKIIKQGMDTKAVVARFEVERQAMAMMDHPRIAKVFEAGATPEGRPYFAMEYIQGQPVNEFCDQYSLAIKERLSIFIEICDAIQHAHTKGIIHRDIKPSNVLVHREDDGELHIKVIDFGVAKATSQRLTDKTLYTSVGQFVGTLEYMSPEQAEMSESGIDTRTDVYALGVLLYELLTGEVPFSGKQLRNAGFDEIRRIIREDEPTRPSTRLSAYDAEETTRISKARGARIDELSAVLKRELEWIPLKALRKNRDERYDSPKHMADDVNRYLVGEPLEAGPVSRWYRTRKFVGRNKMAVAVTSAVLLGLVISLALIITLYGETKLHLARAKLAAEFANELLDSVQFAQADGMDKELVTVMLDRTWDRMNKDFYNPSDELEMRHKVGMAFINLGLYAKAEPHFLGALAVARRLGDGYDRDHIRRRLYMELLYRRWGKYDEAMQYAQEALDTSRELYGDDDFITFQAMGHMGTLLTVQGKFDEAFPYYQQTIDGHRRSVGDDHPQALFAIGNMGSWLIRQGRHEEALPYEQERMEGLIDVLGPDHEESIESQYRMGVLMQNLGRTGEGVSFLEAALVRAPATLGNGHIVTARTRTTLGNILRKQGKCDEATPLLRDGLAGFRIARGDRSEETLYTWYYLVDCLIELGQYEEAEPLALACHALNVDIYGSEHQETYDMVKLLADLREAQGRGDDAQRWREMLPDSSE